MLRDFFLHPPRESESALIAAGQQKGRTRRLGEQICGLAALQHGVISRAQLLELGLTAGELRELGWLNRIHRGVYAVGTVSRLGRWKAAALAVPDTDLHGRSACAFHGLAEDDRSTVHLVGPRKLHSRPGLRLHLGDLEASERQLVSGIPCSEPNRAIADFAATAGRRELERALDQAAYLQLLSLPRLEAYAERPARGSRLLRSVLESHQPGSTMTESDLEELFLSFVDRHGLPRPVFNVKHTLPSGRRIRIDALYRQERIAIELDGRGNHAHVKAFRLDRERDRGLVLQGLRPLRFVRDDLTRHALRTAHELGALLRVRT